MEYILSLHVAYMFKSPYRTRLKSICSIDGNVNWRCGANGTRYALMGKTGSSCMQVRLLPLPVTRCRLGFVGVVKLGIHDRLKICCRKA